MTISGLHGNIATQFRCGAMFNNHITATCP